MGRWQCLLWVTLGLAQAACSHPTADAPPVSRQSLAASSGVVLGPELGFPTPPAAYDYGTAHQYGWSYTIALSAAAGPNGYAVAWARRYYLGSPTYNTVQDDVYVTRVGFDGTAYAPPASPTLDTLLNTYGSILRGAAITWVKSRSVVAWGARSSVYQPTPGGAFATTVSWDGAVGTKITLGTASSTVFSAASNGSTAIVIWKPDSAAAVHAAEISDDGTVIGDTSVDLTTGGTGFSLAFDGTEYLLVWSASGQILGARLGSNGVPLDVSAVPICTLGVASAPRVAWHAPWFLVAWTDSTKGTDTDVYEARVAADLTVQDPDRIPIHTTNTAESLLALTAGGSSYLLTARSGTAVLTTSVDSAGAVVPLASKTLATNVPTLLGAAAASNDAQHLVVLNEKGSRLLDDGTLALPSGFPAAVVQDQYYPSVGSDGNDFVVTWSEAERYITQGFNGIAPLGEVEYAARAARISKTGANLDPQGIVVPARGIVAWDGSNFVVASGPGITTGDRAYRISPTGVADSTAVRVYARAHASDGLQNIFAGSSGWLLHDKNLQLTSTVPYSLSPSCSPTANGMAWTGSNYAVSCYSGAMLYVDLISAAGAQVGSAAVSSTYSSGATVAAGGGRILVAWTDSSGAVRALVQNEDLTGAGPELLVSPTGSSLRASWDGSSFVILWTTATDLFAARVSSDGSLVNDPPLHVASGTFMGASLASTSDGVTAIAYSTRATGPAGSYERILVKVRLLGPATDGGAALDAAVDSDASSWGSGGAVGTGGSISTGGTPGSGGTVSSAGSTGSDSGIATGGTGGTGGSTGGSTGATGGSTGTGGTTAYLDGSATSTGGAATGGGVTSSTGGLTGNGGTTASGDAAASSGGAGLDAASDASVGGRGTPPATPSMTPSAHGSCNLSGLRSTGASDGWIAILAALSLGTRRPRKERRFTAPTR